MGLPTAASQRVLPVLAVSATFCMTAVTYPEAQSQTGSTDAATASLVAATVCAPGPKQDANVKWAPLGRYGAG